MSMKHTHGIGSRCASLFLAVMLLVAMAIVPASAADGLVVGGEDGVEQFTITKYLTKESTTMTPNVSFTFAVTPVTGVSENRSGIPVSDGVLNGVTVSATDSSADFKPNGTLDKNTVLSDTVTFDVNLAAFNNVPGIYKYTIQENTVTYGGITQDTNILNLYVYVENVNGKVQVAYVELVDPDANSEGTGTQEVKKDSFTNDYGSTHNTLFDLTLYKVVSGNAANMNQQFTFSVKVDGEADEQYYAQYGTYINGSFTAGSKSVVLESGTATPIELGDGEAIKIYGLDSNDAYTIVEQDNNSNGYKLKIDGEVSEDGIKNGVLDNDTVVKYENIKEAATPTGIIMSVAPYALLVVLAAGACVVFLRRRGAED